ncbi:MAG TPA: hypothetical protein VNS09_16540 [Solirubrobacter sp.]|nr:hypothetical protein [Solirubrobacter sp.]
MHNNRAALRLLRKVDPQTYRAVAWWGLSDAEPQRPRARTSTPRQRGHARPAARRSAAATQDDDGGDEDPDPAPAEAREAVADAWLSILRERHPGTSWAVVE